MIQACDLNTFEPQRLQVQTAVYDDLEKDLGNTDAYFIDEAKNSILILAYHQQPIIYTVSTKQQSSFSNQTLSSAFASCQDELGNIYVSGGRSHNTNTPNDSIFKFDENGSTFIGNLSDDLYSHSMIANNEYLITRGGNSSTASYEASASCFIYNLQNNVDLHWSDTELSNKIQPSLFFIEESKFIVTSGASALVSANNDSEYFEIGSNVQFSFIESPIEDFSTTEFIHNEINNKFYFVGGKTVVDNLPSNTVNVFDVSSTQFSNESLNLLSSRFNHSLNLISDYRVLVTGGRDEAGNILSSIEILNVALANNETAEFEVEDFNLSNTRFNHSSLLLNDGSILLIGGGTSEIEQLSLQFN